MKFFSIHNHSDYSNIRMLDSTNKINKMIEKAFELDYNGIVITDHESVGGHIEALHALENFKNKYLKSKDEKIKEKIENFKLGLGNEIYLCRDDLSLKNYQKGIDEFYHFILIAKDTIGHRQLRELSSRAWDRSFSTFITRVPTYYRDIEEIVGKEKGHLIASSRCLGGFLPKQILKKDYIKAKNFIKWCQEIFGEDFYIELQPSNSEDQLKFNREILDFIKQENIKIKTIVSTDSHYLTKADRKVHKAFLNSADGDREVDDFYETTYLMDIEEIKNHLEKNLTNEEIISLIENTQEIYNKIEEYDLFSKQIVPRIAYTENVTPNGDLSIFKDYEYIQKYLNSKNEDDIFFIRKIIKKGFELNIFDKAHIERLEFECKEIWLVSEKISENLSAYFSTISKVIEIGWDKANTIIGPWRGSAGSSLCAYLIGIIQRDPLKSPIDLPFLRFISVGRAELPKLNWA